MTFNNPEGFVAAERLFTVEGILYVL